MLNSKLEQLKSHFGLSHAADWQDVEPSWVIAQNGIGPKTLDYLRVLLAARGLTLKNDRTPEYWQAHLAEVQIVDPLGNPDEPGADNHIVCPFTILIDSAEKSPFTFQGLSADADQKRRPLIVPTEWSCLGRHPNSLGDYTVAGLQGRVHVERKSVEDLYGTVLGFRGRRERFECELENLSAIDRGFVVVESSLGNLLQAAPVWGRKTAAENRKTLFRSVLNYQAKFRVQWLFCDDRRLAEVFVFRLFEKYWQREMKKATE